MLDCKTDDNWMVGRWNNMLSSHMRDGLTSNSGLKQFAIKNSGVSYNEVVLLWDTRRMQRKRWFSWTNLCFYPKEDRVVGKFKNLLTKFLEQYYEMSLKSLKGGKAYLCYSLMRFGIIRGYFLTVNVTFFKESKSYSDLTK